MAHFTFQVDREHTLVEPIPFHPDVTLKGEAFTLEAGEAVIYRGLIEIDGKPSWTFLLKDGRKAYSGNREQLEKGLVENYDALAQPR